MSLCIHCGTRIEAHQTRVSFITGYVASRGGGGANHVMRRTTPYASRIWHDFCWERCMRRMDGTPYTQDDLFSVPKGDPEPDPNEHRCKACGG